MLSLLLAAALPARAAAQVDLAGTWHVLVHYRDAESEHPDWLRWEDRLWTFEREGESWVWTEYPVAVFEDRDGRFESIGGGREARVVGGWRPDESQLEEIREGLKHADRGVRRKRLRPVQGRDALESGSPAPAASASILTFSELWAVEDPTRLPVFVRQDTLGGQRAESMVGRTEYATRSVEADGDLLRGRYRRDERREGEFWMTRSGTSELVRGSGQSPDAPGPADALRELADALEADLGLAAHLERVRAAPAPGEDARRRLEQHVGEVLARELSARGNDPRMLAPQLERLADRVVERALDGGESLEAIAAALRGGALDP